MLYIYTGRINDAQLGKRNRISLAHMLFLALLLLAPYQTLAQSFNTTHQLQIAQPIGQPQFGVAVASIGDLDGDHLPEIIIGAPQEDANGTRSGAAHIYSLNPSGTGANFRTIPGGGSYFYSGMSVAGGADVNNDGILDYAVGSPVAPNHALTFTSGRVDVYSGDDGALIYSLEGSSSLEMFGTSIAFGDTNNDGFDDILVSSPFFQVGNNQVGKVTVFSGQNGAVLTSHFGDPIFSQFGRALTSTDVDGDGFDDIIASSPMNGTGRISVYSGQSGSLLYHILGFSLPTYENSGHQLTALGDVDGDGYNDFAAASNWLGNYVSVYSGLSSHRIIGCNLGIGNGFNPQSMKIGDFDRDGYMDLAIIKGGQFGIVSGGSSAASGRGHIIFDHVEPAGGIRASAATSFMLRGYAAFAFGDETFNNNRGRVSVVSRRGLGANSSAATGWSCQGS